MKTFEHLVTVTIGDTNMEGNVYWTNFCAWFGKARELFLVTLFPAEVNIPQFLMEQKLMIITCDVTMKFVSPAFFTDQLVVKINATDFGKCTVDMVATIVNAKDGKIVATGRQKLAFCNAETHKFVPIPDDMKRAALEYEIVTNKD
jgi:acyl-CoA thioesterase FadM